MDAVIPPEEWLNYRAEDWQILGKRLAKLKIDDPVKIGQLLQKFGEGMCFIFKNSTTPNLSVPPLIIDTDLPARTRGAMYDDDEKAIVLSALRLWGQSRHDTTELRETVHDSGELLFRGTTPDSFFLMGVEEADHADFYARHGRQLTADKHSVVEYDTSPIELSGLEARLRAAEHFNMPEETRVVLRMRIENARKFAAMLDSSSQKQLREP